MRNSLVILISLIAFASETNAQIPNNGFETWESYEDDYTHYTYEKPDLWVGGLPNNQAYSFSISKINESYTTGTGQFSIKIQPDIANGVRGVALSNDGHDPMINWIPQPSFAINYRPNSLNLYYKYLPYGGDTMIVQTYFYKNGEVIGNSVFGTTETISNWTALEIPMTYITADIPDSATIYFVTGAYIQHSESILYIDNLSFNGFVTSVSEIQSKGIIFNIFPNPASDMLTIEMNRECEDFLTLYIYNSYGALLKKVDLTQNRQQINISDLCDGMYVVEIQSSKQTGRQKLLVEK